MLLVLCISLGYALLKQVLQINGVTFINKSSWNIYFDNARRSDGSVLSTEDLTIDSTKTIVTFGATLTKPGDYYEFEIDIVNEGTIDAMIESVKKIGIEEPNAKYISFTAEYTEGEKIKKCDLLEANKRNTIKIRAEFKNVDNEEDLPQSNINLNLELQINYVQATTCKAESD